jgi:hypothetical protein
MKTTTRKQAVETVTALATARGYTVKPEWTALTIRLWSKHRKPRLLRGVTIWSTGWASDDTIDLSVKKCFRPTEANLRSVLGLK